MTSITTEALKQFPNISLMVVGMLLFLSVFLTASFFAFNKSRKSQYEKMSQLPLED